MATLVWLRRDEVPSTDGYSALVDQDYSRASSEGVDVVLHRFGAIFYIPRSYGEAEQNSAFKQAKEFARKMDIGTVYITMRVKRFRAAKGENSTTENGSGHGANQSDLAQQIAPSRGSPIPNQTRHDTAESGLSGDLASHARPRSLPRRNLVDS